MKDDPSLKHFFVIDNNRKFFRYRRIIVYNFETEELIMFPDDYNKDSSFMAESNMPHILTLL